MTKRDVTHLSYEIIGSAIKVHKTLGPGLLEGVYEKCLKYEPEQKGYQVLQQAFVPIYYDKMVIDSEQIRLASRISPLLMNFLHV